MIYPDVNLSEWLVKFDLEIEDYHCLKCKNLFKMIIPVMTKDSAGLQSIIHDCGPEYYSVVLTPRTKEALVFWEAIV